VPGSPGRAWYVFCSFGRRTCPLPRAGGTVSLVTTSDIDAELWGVTGDGQILGNLLFNVSHLLDEGNVVSLLLLLTQLSLL
jgi:hypothetical protein